MKLNQERRKIDGNWVKALRSEMGITQKAFADELGVSLPTVARWEIHSFRPSKLAANALLHLADVTRGKGGKTPPK